MSIYANTVIQDALALIDVVAPGEPADGYWSELATRILNGLLGEWSQKGYYNPKYEAHEMYPTTTKDYFTLGISDDIKTISKVRFDIVETLDPAGLYYKSIRVVNDVNYITYSTVGLGSTYSLVITQDTNGSFYQINGGYAQKAVGDIPVNYASLQAVQVDLGTVVYSPKEVSLAEYMATSVKQTQSAPQIYAWDFQQPVSRLYFWPKLLPNMKLRVVGRPTIEAITNNQSTLQIDEIYYTAILYNLACKLYPFLKRDNGIDQELVYMARTALTAIRSKSIALTAKKQTVPYFGNSAPAGDYWISPLNTCNSGF